VSVPAVIPVRDVDGQLLLLSPGLDDAQVRELFAGARLRGDRDGLFIDTPENAGARVADDCFCPECGARGHVLPCPSCSKP
jgi:hypothetical protein